MSYLGPKIERMYHFSNKKHEKKKKIPTTGPNDVSFGPVFGDCGGEREREEADVRGADKKAPSSHVSSGGGAEDGKNTPPTRVSSKGGVVVALEWARGALHEKKALNKGTKL